jgi:hypothetical protein
LFFEKEEKYAVNYLEGTYHLFRGNYMTNFTQGVTKNMYNYSLDPYMVNDSLSALSEEQDRNDELIKGIIQRYNHDLIHNKMTTK